MFALSVDIGRPWNILYMADPWTWNTHSILFEVALCMTAYVMIALDFENLAPLLEHFMKDPFPSYIQDLARFTRRMVKTLYPYGVSLALVLPTMHQSSLGSLMLLSGARVHPLWQTPLLPLLYVVVAFFLGLAFVNLTLMASCAVWKRPMDRDLLASVSDIVSWIAILWLALRIGDVAGRGVWEQAFRFDLYSFVFMTEMMLVAAPAFALRCRHLREQPAQAFPLLFVMCLGGMLYRYTPDHHCVYAGARVSLLPLGNGTSHRDRLYRASRCRLSIHGFVAKIFDEQNSAEEKCEIGCLG